MKKLSGNGLWESSRMMLFEHRDAIIDKQAQQLQKQRPMLDEQQLEAIAERIGSAYAQQKPIQLRVYRAIQDEELSGIITHIDVLNKRIRLENSCGWIQLADILEAFET